LLLAGEYAVLEGWPAVVCAVDRRAHARLGSRAAAELSPFLKALRRHAPAVTRCTVDTSALYLGERKLGLGSSAAATVAAAAAAMQTADRDTIHAVAHVAHARAQEPRGSRGSGADVAAAVHGGLLRVERKPGEGEVGPLAVTPLPWPTGLHMVVVWTGAVADTPALVARVRALHDRDAAAYRAHAAALGECAGRFLGDPIGATAASAEALAALGRAAGAPLVPPSFAPLSALARELGGAAKPTGAGGGDLVVALFAVAAAAAAFRERVQALGMTVVPCAVDPRGVTLADGPNSE
jgi:phosphomevalonate kinase